MPSCQEKRSHSSESGPAAPFHWGTRLPLEVHSCAYCPEDLGWGSAETRGKVGLVPWVLERSNPASQRCPPHLIPVDCRVSTLAHPGVLETIWYQGRSLKSRVSLGYQFCLCSQRNTGQGA